MNDSFYQDLAAEEVLIVKGPASSDARRDPLLQAEDLRQTLLMLQTKGAVTPQVRPIKSMPPSTTNLVPVT